MVRVHKIAETAGWEFFSISMLSNIRVPLYESPVSTGFPSPADDVIELPLNLNDFLVKHPAATFVVRVDGDSMKDAGIRHKDYIVVDRSLNPEHGMIIVGVLNNEFTVKRLRKEGETVYLDPANPKYSPIRITEEMNFVVWGVVTSSITKF